jgi:hypothetical protein
MCSQRLTGAGRLCRECDRELARARALAESVEGVAWVTPLVDAAREADDRWVWTARLPSRPAMLFAAFVVGIGAAITFYAIDVTGPRDGSVMLGRDLSGIRPREQRLPVAFAGEQRAAVPSEHVSDVVAMRSVQTQRTPASSHRANVVSTTPAGTKRQTDAADAPQSAQTVAMTAEVVPTGAEPYDRVLGLADALDGCSHQPIFGRIACEHRARERFCNDPGALQIPQCADRPPRDYGQ